MNLVLLPLLLASASTPASPAKLGLCVSCHGSDGRARTPSAPHLGGQNEAYLVSALLQYRDGRRADQAMRAVAGALSRSDIATLAGWYARQPWPVTQAPVR